MRRTAFDAMDERGRGETAKHGYGVTLYDPKVRDIILQFNPIQHGSGRGVSTHTFFKGACFWERPEVR